MKPLCSLNCAEKYFKGIQQLRRYRQLFDIYEKGSEKLLGSECAPTNIPKWQTVYRITSDNLKDIGCM